MGDRCYVIVWTASAPLIETLPREYGFALCEWVPPGARTGGLRAIDVFEANYAGRTELADYALDGHAFVAYNEPGCEYGEGYFAAYRGRFAAADVEAYVETWPGPGAEATLPFELLARRVFADAGAPTPLHWLDPRRDFVSIPSDSVALEYLRGVIYSIDPDVRWTPVPGTLWVDPGAQATAPWAEQHPCQVPAGSSPQMIPAYEAVDTLCLWAYQMRHSAAVVDTCARALAGVLSRPTDHLAWAVYGARWSPGDPLESLRAWLATGDAAQSQDNPAGGIPDA